MAQAFEDLEIWQLARSFANKIYMLTNKESFSKDFGLVNQIRNSSGSVMDNIAEGHERNGNKEFKQFLYIAKASCGETRSQLYRSYDRKHITDEELQKQIDDAKNLSRKIYYMIKHLSNSDYKGDKYK